MFDKNSHYIIISAFDKNNDDQVNKILTSKLENLLYSKDYNFKKVYTNEKVSFIAQKKEKIDNINNELRYDSIELIHEFYQNECIVKYEKEDDVKKIMQDGSERKLKIIKYNEDADYSYYSNGFSFSFINMQEYFYPKKKSDLKKGMIVEMHSKNKWISKKIKDLDKEWEKMYSILIRYGKLRSIKNLN